MTSTFFTSIVYYFYFFYFVMDCFIKVSVCGFNCVSTFFIEYCIQQSKGKYDDIIHFTFSTQGVNVHLEIWDSVTNSRFSSMNPILLRGSHICLLFIDVTDEHSFSTLDRDLSFIKKYINETTEIIVVGNVVDENTRKIPKSLINEYVERERISFFEISLHDSDGIEDLLNTSISIVLPKLHLTDNNSVNLVPVLGENYVSSGLCGGDSC